MFVFEFEVVLLYCMYFLIYKDSDNFIFGVFKFGEKYMVVDVGGIIMYLNFLFFNIFNVFDFKLLFILI